MTPLGSVLLAVLLTVVAVAISKAVGEATWGGPDEGMWEQPDRRQQAQEPDDEPNW